MRKLIEFLALISFIALISFMVNLFIELDPSKFNEYLLLLFNSCDFNVLPKDDFTRFGLTQFTCFYSTKVSKIKEEVKEKERENEKFLRDGYLIEEAAVETKIKEEVKERENEKFLRDGYLIEEAAVETKRDLDKVKVVKELEKPLKIVINGLVFNKLKDEL
jgi:hypothetical protein